jgi:hypothetical protein
MTRVMEDIINRILDKNVYAIICDDCLYTGSLMLQNTTIFPNMINLDKKYELNKKEPSKYSKSWITWTEDIFNHKNILVNKNISKLKIFVLATVTTTPAKKLLTSKKYIHLIYGKEINSFINEIDIKHYRYVRSKVRSEFSKNISAIYFDHKIADSVSTFNEIYILGKVSGCPSVKYIKFIDGCDNDKGLSELSDELKNKKMDKYPSHDFELTSNNKICPPSFYKTIKWTFNSVEIPKHNFIIDYLYNNSSK